MVDVLHDDAYADTIQDFSVTQASPMHLLTGGSEGLYTPGARAINRVHPAKPTEFVDATRQEVALVAHELGYVAFRCIGKITEQRGTCPQRPEPRNPDS
jgi:hypothetical protein